MILGLESGVVRLVPYHAAWPRAFMTESRRLRRQLQDAGLPVTLEHMGSTAVPGLIAKPVLDILAGYPRGADPAPYVRAFADAGYVHRGEQEIPGREFFRRGDPRAYHVHLVAIGSPFWLDHLAFRDRLRADVALRDAYAALKWELAGRFPNDRASYIEGKTDFVRSVLAR